MARKPKPKIKADVEYSTTQIAELLQFADTYIRREVRDGRIPARRVSRMWIVKGADVLTWLEKRPGKGGRWANVETDE